MARKQRHKNGRQFLRLWTNVKRSEAYHSLDPYARSALIELLDKYTGINNGMIAMGCRELMERLHCAPATAVKALHAIDDAGLARPMDIGTYRGQKATTWRLTFYRCDATGELPVTHWAERQTCSRSETQRPISVRVVRRKSKTCSRGETQKPKNLMNGEPTCSRSEAHIDIYHTPKGAGGVPIETLVKARKRAGLDPAAAILKGGGDETKA